MNKPKVGNKFTDIDGRELNVQEVRIGDLLGREITGIMWHGIDGVGSNYSCTLKMWEEIWRDKVPRADPEKMKIG